MYLNGNESRKKKITLSVLHITNYERNKDHQNLIVNSIKYRKIGGGSLLWLIDKEKVLIR
jgi:hypothetical protein